MPTTLDDSKSELLSKVCDYAAGRTRGRQDGELQSRLLRAYYRQDPLERYA